MYAETSSECQVCGDARLEFIHEISKLRRITSDCRPFPAGGQIAICCVCGTVQTVPTAIWREEVAQIYQDYKIYDQSSGVEQGVWNPQGELGRRSEVLARWIRREGELHERGRTLDVGCGNGAMLKSFSAEMPLWRLYGLDLDDKYRSVIELIPGVESLYLGGIESVEGRFDLVTMLHALEHFEEPLGFLGQLKSRIAPGGMLFIEVPDFEANPFDLLVADHCCHFTLKTLGRLIDRAGYDVIQISRELVKKELSVLARPRLASTKNAKHAPPREIDDVIDLTKRSALWLTKLVNAARHLSEQGSFALFGTSLAATWLSIEVGQNVGSYIDEDPSRHGYYLGRPVIPPSAIPTGANVFLPFPPAVAAQIAERFKGKPFTLHLPPALA